MFLRPIKLLLELFLELFASDLEVLEVGPSFGEDLLQLPGLGLPVCGRESSGGGDGISRASYGRGKRSYSSSGADSSPSAAALSTWCMAAVMALGRAGREGPRLEAGRTLNERTRRGAPERARFNYQRVATRRCPL